MIDDHDYDVKMRSMQRFFEEGDKVKVTLRFRGREMAHQELGTGCSTASKDDTAKIAKVEKEPASRPPDDHGAGAAISGADAAAPALLAAPPPVANWPAFAITPPFPPPG